MQCMLDLVTELRQNGVGNITWILGDKEDTYTLGTYELNNLLDLIHKSLGGIIKQ